MLVFKRNKLSNTMCLCQGNDIIWSEMPIDSFNEELMKKRASTMISLFERLIYDSTVRTAIIEPGDHYFSFSLYHVQIQKNRGWIWINFHGLAQMRIRDTVNSILDFLDLHLIIEDNELFYADEYGHGYLPFPYPVTILPGFQQLEEEELEIWNEEHRLNIGNRFGQVGFNRYSPAQIGVPSSKRILENIGEYWEEIIEE